MTKIKICGITNLTDALLAADLGVDALGFIFAPSPRHISSDKAREITGKLPPFIHKVGVFKNENINLVKDIMEKCSLDFVQLHGEEDPSYVQEFDGRAIKVFEISGQNILKEIKKYSLPFFMLDLPKKAEGTLNQDWGLIKKVKSLGRLIFAGALTPENIKGILKNTTPYAVDVCRGVESTRGKKDPKKMEEFILKVRQWDIQKT